jgi:hypothetical protein
LTFKFPTAAALTAHLANLIFPDSDEFASGNARRIEVPATSEPASHVDVQMNIGRELAELEKLLGAE